MKEWKEHPTAWVTGSINVDGSISLSPDKINGGVAWKWSVHTQRFCDVVENGFTISQAFIVWDWLSSHGFTDDNTKPRW